MIHCEDVDGYRCIEPPDVNVDTSEDTADVEEGG